MIIEDYVEKDIAIALYEHGFVPEKFGCEYVYSYETIINPEVEEKYNPDDRFTDSDYYELTKDGGGELDWDYVYIKEWVFRKKEYFGKEIPAPTIYEVQRWFRKKGYDIMIDKSFTHENSWHYVVVVDNDFGNSILEADQPNRHYEKALHDAIIMICMDILKIV